MSKGFSEDETPYLAMPFSVDAPLGGVLTETVRLGPGGRVVIPAEFREAMGLRQGDAMLATLEDKKLTLVTYMDTIRSLQEGLAKYIPADVCLSQELIADRRAEVAREEAEDEAT